jgi:translation initiation factor 1
MGRKNNRNSMSEEDELLQALSGAPIDSEKPVESPPLEANVKPPEQPPRRGQKNTTRGRVDIIRQTAHRGGKAVIVVQNFKGIGLPEKQALAKKMQKFCGVGGTVKDGRIEIQGDKRDEVKRILTEAGFNPVFAGG